MATKSFLKNVEIQNNSMGKEFVKALRDSDAVKALFGSCAKQTIGNDTLISGDGTNINGSYLIQLLRKLH